MKRKIFAAFLSLMMVISMLPTSAFASEVEVPADCQHENAHWETVKEATCTVAGVESAHCPDCDKDVTRGIPATGHAPKEEWVVVDGSYEPADCEHAGHETYVCPNCDGQEDGGSETRDIKEDPALGHDIKKTVVKPTCKDGGYTLEECTRCDYSKETNPTDPTGEHNMVLVSELRKADCKTGTNGIGRYACSVCGESGGYQVIPAEHVKEEDKANSKPATCKDEGKIAYKCAVCGKELESEVVPVTDEHTPVEGIIEATCTTNEKVGKKCAVCNKDLGTVEMPGTALGHDVQPDTAKSKAATCTEAGVKAVKCSRCDWTDSEEVPALGHKWVSAGLQEADCQHAAGEKFVCENDSSHTDVKEFEGELAEPKKEHTPKVIPGVDPTCTTTGLTAGLECEVCHEILTAQEEIPVDEDAHKAVVATVLRKPVCGGQNGIVRMECELCHKNLGYEVVSNEHDPVEATRVEPTCGKDGKVTYKCSRCGEALPDMDEVLDATGEHTIIKKAEYMVTVSEATCTENKKIAYKCSVCGEVSEPEEVPESALGHKYVEDTKDPEYKKATCEEDGLIVKVCATCGDRKTEPDKATGKHQWNDGVDTSATCTTPGGATYTCLKCGATKFEAYTGELAEPAKDHANTEVLEAVPATCSTTGLTEGLKCKDCGKILVPQTETKKNENHKPVVAKELRPAKCGGQTGIVRLECELCHTNLGYDVISNDHIPVEATHVDATCGTAGKVTYKCSRCGEALPEMDKVIPATGKHTFDKNDKDETHFVIVEPSCTEPGKVTPKCLVCGAEIESEATIVGTALGHDPEINKEDPEYKAVTCEEDGLITYKCKRCHEKLEPKVEKATGEHKWSVEAKLIPATCTEGEHLEYKCTLCPKTKTETLPGMQKALGHVPKEDVHPATCKAAGYTLVTCAREGCDYKDTIPGDPANPNNHTYGEPYHLRKATCDKTGIDKLTCVDCGYYKYEVAEKLAHTLLDENAEVTKEATCVADGEITNKCTVCGTVVTEKIPATGKHTPVEIPETDTMSAGEKCSVCGTILKEPVKKADCEHKNLVPIDEVPATCTSTGLSVGLKCGDCGKVIEAQTVTPKLDHTVVEIPAKEATCTATGLTAGEECSVCHTVLKAQETVPAKGHTAVEVPGKEATCTETGLTAGEKCSVCNEVLKAQETVPMKEHTVVEIPAKEATCTETGLTAGEECSVCHKVLKAQETVPMKEHTEEIIEAVAATCTKAGHKEGVKCSACGTILMEPETVEALGHDYTEYVGAGEDDKGAYIEYKCSRCDATEKQYAE